MPRIVGILSYILCSELIHYFREIFNVTLGVPNLPADGEIHARPILVSSVQRHYRVLECNSIISLLKIILDSCWNKLLCKFCITVRRFHARVQSSACVTYEKCNNDRANSKIGHTTDCLYSFWDRQKAEFCMLWLCAFFPPAINFCRSKEKFSQVYWTITVTQCTDL